MSRAWEEEIYVQRISQSPREGSRKTKRSREEDTSAVFCVAVVMTTPGTERLRKGFTRALLCVFCQDRCFVIARFLLLH